MRVDGTYSGIQFLIFLILTALSSPSPLHFTSIGMGTRGPRRSPPPPLSHSSFFPSISMLKKKMLLASFQVLSGSFFSLYPKGIPSVVFGKQRKMNPFSQPLSTSPWKNQRRIHASWRLVSCDWFTLRQTHTSCPLCSILQDELVTQQKTRCNVMVLLCTPTFKPVLNSHKAANYINDGPANERHILSTVLHECFTDTSVLDP
jgi:hypothetical protein